MKWLIVAAGFCLVWPALAAAEPLYTSVQGSGVPSAAQGRCAESDASCPPLLGADNDIVVSEELPLLHALSAADAGTPAACFEPTGAGFSSAPGTVCLPNDGAQYFVWDKRRPNFGAPRRAPDLSAEGQLTPITIGAQPAFAMLSADSFLRRGTPGQGSRSGLAIQPPPERFTVGVNRFVFVRHSIGPVDSSLSTDGFGYGLTSLGLGVAQHPNGGVTFGLVGGLDRGLGGWGDGQAAVDFQSFRFSLIASSDAGRRFAGAGFTYGFDHYGPTHQSLMVQMTALGALDGQGLGSYAAAAYRFTQGDFSFGPRLELRYLGLGLDKTKAKGQRNLEQRARSLVGSAGLGLARSLSWWDGVATPHLRAAVEGQALNGIDTGLFTVPDVMRGLALSRDQDVYGRFNGGLDLAITRGVTASINGDSALFSGSDNDSHRFFISASFAF